MKRKTHTWPPYSVILGELTVSKTGMRFFQLALSPLVSVRLLRTDAPASGGAARNGEGKVNSLIGMSTIPHTYLTPKPWELQPKSKTFQSRENSQAVKSSIYCQLQYLISIFWLWVSQYFLSTVTTLTSIFLLFLSSSEEPSSSVLWSNSLVHPYWYFLNKVWSIDRSKNQKQKLTEHQILQRKSVFKWRCWTRACSRVRGWLVNGVTILKSTGVYSVLWH